MSGPPLEGPSQRPKLKALRNTQQEPPLTGLPAGIAVPGLACPPQQDYAHTDCQTGCALMHSMTCQRPLPPLIKAAVLKLHLRDAITLLRTYSSPCRHSGYLQAP